MIKKPSCVSRIVVAGLVLAPLVAWACTVYSGIQFDVNVGAVSSGVELGEELEDRLGDVYGPDTSVEGVVRYQARLPVLNWTGGLMSIPFTKGCGETFRQRANSLFNNSVGGAAGGTGGGGGAGGGGFGIVGFSPVYVTATVCSGGVCTSQQVLVGYDPIYGRIGDTRAIS